MSWRQVLGVEKPTEESLTQNTQNTHKTSDTGNFADIANSAETERKLLSTLSTVCNSLTVTPEEVYNALTPDDVESWQNGDMSVETLAAFAEALAQRREMEQGKVPAHYNKRAVCSQCGPVWLWFSGEVLGCPWCWNRTTGRPIPRPNDEQKQ